jgi:NCAIR mutase (PurE)-related protein
VNRDRLLQLLQAVASGRTTPGTALSELETLPFEDLGFANLDLHRELRSGLPEGVFGAGKSVQDLLRIAERLVAAHDRLLVTRVSAAQAEALGARFPAGRYGESSRVFWVGGMPRIEAQVAIVSGGTSDAAVAEEAADCARWCGLEVQRLFDVGVAGVHRLLSRLEVVRGADAVIAVAGMDGALPTLVAGLVSTPVVAVPTSVGYGAAFGGVAALLTMLNACAPGVAVVNIDNGYGAAVLTYRMLRLRNIASP